MPHIEYLGFVVRHDAKEPQDFVAACVAKLNDNDEVFWKAYPPGEYNFIPMLFVTSVMIKQKLAELANVEDGWPAGNTLLKKPNPKFDFILNHLYDVRSKAKSYTSLPNDLRQVVRFFFVLYGQKSTIRLQAPQNGLRPQQIFFWTVNDFLEQTGAKLLPTSPTPIKVTADPPQSNPHIALRIPLLAEKVRLYLAQPEPWQKLYKKAVRPPDDLPTHKIPLYGSRIYLPGEKKQQLLYKEQHLQLSEMVSRYRKILLTGPSGSGKTTILKILTADLLGRKSPIGECLPIFVSLKDMGFKGKSVTDLVVDTVVKEILTAKSLKSTIQQQIDIRKALYSKMADPESSFAAEVKEFFASYGEQDDIEIALFLDGYNEIPETEAYAAEQEIQRLVKRVGYMVVSTHPYAASRFPLRFTRFELEELSDGQIITYLNLQLEGKGGQFFDDKIAPNGRILSTARVPFYLELILDYHKTHPDRRLPTCPGPLLKFFVERQYEKKREVKQLRFPDVTQPEIDFFLRKIAHRLIDKGIQTPETVLYYPDDLVDIFSSSVFPNPARVAKAAELIGFHDKSGQISEEPGAPGVISFKHDNIRDYFAAQEFKNEKVFDNPAIIESYLEYTKWDNVWLMLFGIIENEENFEKALSEIAALDLCFASECLLASPLADTKHSDKLLKLLPMAQIRDLKIKMSAPPLPDSYTYISCVEGVLQSALSRVLSLYSPEYLCDLYNKLSTDNSVKATISWALVCAHGKNALPYLQTIIQNYGLSCHSEVLEVLGSLQCDKVLDLLVKLYIQAIKEHSDIEEHLESIISNWGGCLSIRQLLENAELLEKSLGRQKNYPKYISCLLTLLEKGKVGTSEDWLELYHHSNPYVSYAARCALRDTRHPTIIDEIIQKCHTAKLDTFSEDDQVDFAALVNSGNEAGEEELLLLLERACARHRYDLIQSISYRLGETKNRRILQRMVNLGLYGTGAYTMEALYWPIAHSREFVKELVLSQVCSRRVSSNVRTRAVIAIALCRDKSVKTELLPIFTKHLSSLTEVPDEPSEKREESLHFFNYIREAILHTAQKEVKPILKTIAKRAPPGLQKQIADFMLVSIEMDEKYRDGEINRLLQELEHAHKDLDVSRDLVDFWVQKTLIWPTEKIEKVLEYTSNSAQKAFNCGDIRTAGFFCYATEQFKTFQEKRRFLHIFRGWPGFLPKDA